MDTNREPPVDGAPDRPVRPAPDGPADRAAEPGREQPPGGGSAQPVRPPANVVDLARRATSVSLGVAGMLVGAATEAVERYVPGEPGGRAPDAGPAATGIARELPGAVRGLGLEASRFLFDAAETVEVRSAEVVGFVTRPAMVQSALQAAQEGLARLNERGAEQSERNREAVADLVRAALPDLVTVAVTQLDMNQIVDQLLAELDVGALIRESTASIGGETVDALRMLGIRLDRFVARVVDRILFRHRERELEVPGLALAEHSIDPAAVLAQRIKAAS